MEEKRDEVQQEKASSTTSAEPERVGEEDVPELKIEERTCHRCQTEYTAVRTPLGRWLPDSCPSCYPVKAAPEKRTAAPAPLEPPKDVLDALHECGVNVNKYQDATLDRFDSSFDPAAMAAARDFIKQWESTFGKRFPRRDWLYLFGGGSTVTDAIGPNRIKIGKLGNGKTFLAIAIARHLVDNGLLHPGKFAFRSAEEILLECEATFRDKSPDSESQLLHRYERYDLLIIDDFGVRAEPSAHAIRVFDELTKKREAKATIWTSNLSIKVVNDLSEGMKRIASRLSGEVGDSSAFYVEFNGPNRRTLRSRRSA